MVFRSLVKLLPSASLVPASSAGRLQYCQRLPIRLPQKHHPDTNTQIFFMDTVVSTSSSIGAGYHLEAELSKRIALSVYIEPHGDNSMRSALGN